MHESILKSAEGHTKREHCRTPGQETIYLLDEKQTIIVRHKNPHYSQKLIGTPQRGPPFFSPLIKRDTEKKQEKVRHSYFIGVKLNSYHESPEEREEDEPRNPDGTPAGEAKGKCHKDRKSESNRERGTRG